MQWSNYKTFEGENVMSNLDRDVHPDPIRIHKGWVLFGMLLGLFLAFLFFVALAHAGPGMVTVTTCNQVLTGPTTYQLLADLECDAVGIILDSATFLLNGHTIHCNYRVLGCVVLRGSRSRIENGTIDEDYHESLVLEGEGQHRVDNLTITPIDATVVVRSHRNRLTNVTAMSGMSPAFRIQGNGNLLVHLIATCPIVMFGGCVDVKGDTNRLEDLDVTLVDDFEPVPWGAVRVRGNKNEVRLSTLRNSQGPALIVEGTGNAVIANRLFGVVDAVDMAGCDQNRWRRNLLDTANPPCVMAQPGPETVADLEGN